MEAEREAGAEAAGVLASETLREEAGDLPQLGGDVDLYPTMLRSLSPSATPGKSAADQSMIAGSMLMIVMIV